MDVIAAVPGRARDPSDRFAITAVQGEGYAQFGVVLATELKAVRAPTRIAGFAPQYVLRADAARRVV